MKFKPFAKRAARVLALGLGIPLVLLVLFAMIFGDSFIYFPSKYPEGDWQPARDSSVVVEDVSFAAADGTKLHAWYCKVPDAKATVLLLHGNAGNVTNRYHYITLLRKTQLAVFIPDYRGYGKSEGKPSESGLTQDAEASYAWLTSHGVAPESLILYSESLGCGPAIELATRVKVAGLILQCAFSSISDLQMGVIPIPLGWVMRTKMANTSKIGRVTCPKLQFHSPADEVIPYKLARRLHDAAAEPRRFVEYPGLGHNDWPGRYESEWRAEIKQFVAEVVK